MKSAKPKVLHHIGAYSLLEHVYRLAQQVAGDDITIIYGHGGERLINDLGHLKAKWVEQKERLGTGHAVMQASDIIEDDSKVLILYGDVPLLQVDTVKGLLDVCDENSAGLLTVCLDNPFGYGRILRNSEGKVQRSVEEKDATDEERNIQEVNTGILAVCGEQLKKCLSRLSNSNAQNEYYLTDVIGLTVSDGLSVNTFNPMSEDEVLGVNSRSQLAHLERALQTNIAGSLMERGVTLRDPDRIDVRGELLHIGQDVEIDINVVLSGNIEIGDNVRIGANCSIKDTRIGDNVEILPNSVIEDSLIGDSCRIGPFARLRPETALADHVHVGNFVEIKKSDIADQTKISHLSYIGDSTVGSRVNVGAGTITCNYDGANKFQTTIEDDVFIGSDTQLIAPVTIKKNSTIGAGSTITRTAPENKLTLSRSKQFSINGWQRPVKRK